MADKRAYHNHVEGLIKQHKLHRKTIPHWIQEGGYATPGTRLIQIQRVRSSITYAIAMHEIGHILGRQSASSNLMCEAYAWRWAIANSIEWTIPMCKTMRRCLSTYLADHLQRGHNPPPDEWWKIYETRPGKYG